jgi:hypothetical protein
MQLIGRISEFSSRSLPPVPPVPAMHSSAPSRPTSTYSNSSEKERYGRHQYCPQYHQNDNNGQTTTARVAPPPTAEVKMIIDASHKTMSTLLAKLEVCRLALEVAESPKECQALVNQIKGLMECLKACREVL